MRHIDQQKAAWFESGFCVKVASCIAIDNGPFFPAKFHHCWVIWSMHHCAFEWTREKDRKKISSFRCLLNGQDLFCVYRAHSGTLQICCWGLFVLCCWRCGQIAPTINNHEVPSQACVCGGGLWEHELKICSVD